MKKLFLKVNLIVFLVSLIFAAVIYFFLRVEIYTVYITALAPVAASAAASFVYYFHFKGVLKELCERSADSVGISVNVDGASSLQNAYGAFLNMYDKVLNTFKDKKEIVQKVYNLSEYSNKAIEDNIHTLKDKFKEIENLKNESEEVISSLSFFKQKLISVIEPSEKLIRSKIPVEKLKDLAKIKDLIKEVNLNVKKVSFKFNDFLSEINSISAVLLSNEENFLRVQEEVNKNIFKIVSVSKNLPEESRVKMYGMADDFRELSNQIYNSVNNLKSVSQNASKDLMILENALSLNSESLYNMTGKIQEIENDMAGTLNFIDTQTASLKDIYKNIETGSLKIDLSQMITGLLDKISNINAGFKQISAKMEDGLNSVEDMAALSNALKPVMDELNTIMFSFNK